MKLIFDGEYVTLDFRTNPEDGPILEIVAPGHEDKVSVYGMQEGLPDLVRFLLDHYVRIPDVYLEQVKSEGPAGGRPFVTVSPLGVSRFPSNTPCDACAMNGETHFEPCPVHHPSC